MEAPRIIVSPIDAFALFAELADEADERFVGACIDCAGLVVARRSGQPGTAGTATLPITELLREALISGASALIVAHNHPSGDPTPSLQDVRVTRRLADGAQAVGIKLIDHLVVARGGWSSFRLLGLM